MNEDENEHLTFVLENSNLKPQEFQTKIPAKFKKNKHHESKIISLYTIHHLFKPIQDRETHVFKLEAYNLYEKTLKKQKLGSPLNISQFGKLLALLSKDNPYYKIRRIGSRTSTRYCYFGVTLRNPEIFKSNEGSSNPRLISTCMDKMVRFRYLNANNKFSMQKNYKFNKASLASSEPFIAELDDLFRAFLTDSQLTLSEEVSSQPVPNLIFKCFQNSNVFIKEIDTKMFKIMFEEFEELNIFEKVILKELKHYEKNECLSRVNSSIRVFFEDELNPYNNDCNYLKNYFNILIDSSSNINFLKLKIVNFILQTLKIFNYESFPNILLNFKHLTTSVLRELSINRKSTFTLYWYLLSSMDELIRVILEYYTLKKLNY